MTAQELIGLALRAYREGLAKPATLRYAAFHGGRLYCCGLTAAMLAAGAVGAEELREMAEGRRGDAVAYRVQAWAATQGFSHAWIAGFLEGFDRPLGNNANSFGAFQDGLRAARQLVDGVRELCPPGGRGSRDNEERAGGPGEVSG